MKPLILFSLVLVALLLVVPSCAPQRPNPSEVQKIMEESDAAMIKAMLAKDDSTIATFYAQDAIVMPAHAPMIKGHDKIRALYKEVLPGLLGFNVKQLEAGASDSLAYEVCQYVGSMQLPSGAAVQDTGKYVEVFKLQPNGKWLIVADISNSDLPLPPPPAEKKKK